MPAFPDIGDGDVQYTSSGVPFEYIFENYREQFTNRASNATIKARVAWEDSEDFVSDITGYTTGVAGQNKFNRYLPLWAPGIDTLFCTDATLLSYPSSTKAGANQPSIGGFPWSTDWAIYQLTFTRLPYFVASNETVTGADIPELYRYVVRSERPRAREFTVNSYALVVEANPTQFIKQPAFVMDREQDIFLTLCEVPMDVYPEVEITAALGNINNTALVLPVSFSPPDTYTTVTLAQDTLLFRGVAQQITSYQGPTGNWYKDIPYFFTYRPGGWRKLPDPAGTGAQVTVIYAVVTPTKYLYNRVEFSTLFKPKA